MSIEIATIEITQKQAEELQRLLDISTITEFQKENLPIDETIATFTAVFKDGMEADIKVCTGDKNCYIDPSFI